MSDKNIPVTEDELHAYVDGELPEERLAAVEAWLQSHPSDAERVAAWRAMSDMLHAKYDRVADEPVPSRLDLDRLDRRPQRWAYMAIAAALTAFVMGGGVGYALRSVTAPAVALASVTGDALEAHKLYVVDVRHPVEITADQRTHLQQWLTNRCGWQVRAPELDSQGLILMGGRLLPGPTGPASFLMYQASSGDRYTIYASRTKTQNSQMRYAAQDDDGTLYWVNNGVAYVVTGPTDKDKLSEVAKTVYDQSETEKL
ncbi:MAG: anti-sigma factor [Xanthobacteraceae bacterium]|nr:anti-sigma factor [Xanthobacteraceae bacterium]